MKRDSKLSELFKALVVVVLIVAGVKIFWTVVAFYLPVEGVDAQPISKGGKLYYRYRLATDTQKPKKHQRPTKRASTIRDLSLQAVYKDSSNTIAVVEYRGKSHVLVKGDTINGFKLINVTENSAEFIKGVKHYTLKLKEPKIKNGAYEPVAPVQKRVSKPTKKIEKRDETPSVVTINRENIEKYIKNMDKIWKDISITDMKRNGKLLGFKVRYIRKGSFFEKIGLKRGDLIVEINGEKIVDYSLPMKKLREFNTLDGLTLTIIRNGERKELDYEIE